MLLAVTQGGQDFQAMFTKFWWRQAHLKLLTIERQRQQHGFAFAAIGQGMNPVWIFLGAALVMHIVLRYTRYGKFTYAIGANAQAARVTGINVERHIVKVYAVAGLLAGLAAIVVAARGLTAQAGMGVMYELDAIAMAVIGGVSLNGGRGSILGTMIGMVMPCLRSSSPSSATATAR